MRLQDSPAVLVVEDEALTRMVAVDTISELGVESLEATNAAEALEVLEGHPNVRVLFTDINMPGAMDGVGLARKVNDLRPDIELILTSAAETLTEAEMPDSGTFLPKPYREQQLVAVLEEKLSRLT